MATAHNKIKKEVNLLKNIAIVGGGVGGLFCALSLQNQGHQVSIYEKRGTVGGVACHKESKGYVFDSFATIGLHPKEYLNPFLQNGLNPKDYFNYTYLDPLYKVFYSDNSSFLLPKEWQEHIIDFANFFIHSTDEYSNYIDYMYSVYKNIDKHLLTNSLKGVLPFMSSLGSLPAITKQKSAVDMVNSFISNPKLKELLLFQSYFMGFDPHKLPMEYSTIGAVSQNLGLIYVKGGMGAYIKALESAIIHLGGTIHTQSQVDKISCSKNLVKGIEVNGTAIPFDIVIANCDYHFAKENLLCHQPKRDYEMSCSVFNLHCKVNSPLPMLCTHNFYMGENFNEEITMATKGALPKTPPLYIYYPRATDDTVDNIINIMIRVPNLSFKDIKYNEDTIANLTAICQNALYKITGQEDFEVIDYTTPNTMEQDYNLKYGAAFGIAPKLTQSIFFRPNPRSKQYSNLYYIGTNIHPGNGISIVKKGADIVFNAIEQDHPPLVFQNKSNY